MSSTSVFPSPRFLILMFQGISFEKREREREKRKGKKNSNWFLALTIGELKKKKKNFQMGNIYEKSHLSEK